MIAPVNNVVINNDVASSHRRRRMDSMSSIEGMEGMEGIVSIVGIESIESIEGIVYRRYRTVGIRYQKYRSIAIPLNIGIELSQVSRYIDISNQHYYHLFGMGMAHSLDIAIVDSNVTVAYLLEGWL